MVLLYLGLSGVTRCGCVLVDLGCGVMQLKAL